MKKVLFVISSLDTGGAQRAVSNIVTNFPNDWEIDILLNSKKNIVFPYKGTIISLDVEIPKNRTNIYYLMHVFIKRLFRLKKLKKQNNYIACISFLESANIANVLTGNTYCKTILSIRNNLKKQKKLSFIKNKIVKILYPRADKIIALSKGVELNLVNDFLLPKDKIKTIYNCYDLKRIVNHSRVEISEQYKAVLDRKKNIATMGRYSNQKGQWHLIRSFQKVVKEIPDAKLLILGDGELREYYQKLIKDLNLENHIILMGFLENPFSVLKACKLFVFPSLYEGFGNALLEAMCCELPCIATDFRYGAREILAPKTDVLFETKNQAIDEEYGIIVPVCSGVKEHDTTSLEAEEEILADTIIRCLKEKELLEYYRKQSIKRVKDFEPEHIVHMWIEELEKGEKN